MGGALFLACSWTWVVGMVLPIYLVRDFGPIGWAAFAIPNVVGAMSVGFVFARRARLDRFIEQHCAALACFSAVTVLFHLSVLSRLAMQTGIVAYQDRFDPWLIAAGGAGFAALLALIALTLALLPRAWRGAWWWLAAACYLASLALLSIAGANGMLGLPDVTPNHDPWMVFGAVPALAFGFLLCPHMDLTLLRVRREVGGTAGNAAFVVGFGVLFLAMIVATLLYSDVRTLPLLVFAHLCVQSTFTMGAHLRELRERASAMWWALGSATALTVIAGSALLPMVGAYREGYAYSRLAYELFISAYGLVFPAYLWIVAIAPGARSLSHAARLKLWAITLVITGPMFWVGYVEQAYAWLVVGVGVALASPCIAGRFAPQRT